MQNAAALLQAVAQEDKINRAIGVLTEAGPSVVASLYNV
jgi:hypothetical protein